MQKIILEKLLKEFCNNHQMTYADFEIAFSTTWQSLIKDIDLQFQKHHSKPFIVGFSAPQGAGKSTLCELFQVLLTQQYMRRVVVLSLDDFYKTRHERATIAADLHPLFETRGVPGTHDLQLANRTLQNLANPEISNVPLVKFDKGLDNRAAPECWPVVETPVDIIILEGWCLGIPPQSQAELFKPINELERTEDGSGSWRQQVNQFLAGEYQRFFSRIDYLIYLSAPSFHCVEQWRREQEEKLVAQLTFQEKSTTHAMQNEQLHHFMQHFERLTQVGFIELPKIADRIVALDAHRIPSIIR